MAKKQARKGSTRKKRVVKKKLGGRGATKKKAKVAREKGRRVGSKKVTRRRRVSGRSSSAGVEAIQSQIEKRTAALEDRREKLMAELDSVEGELAAFYARFKSVLGARPATRRGTKGLRGPRTGRRRRHQGNLVEALKKALGDKTMAIPELVSAVQKAGYRSSSPNFRGIVSQTLGKNSDVFKRSS